MSGAGRDSGWASAPTGAIPFALRVDPALAGGVLDPSAGGDQTVRTLRYRAPEVHGQEVRFSWDEVPASGLYRSPGFQLAFPDDVDPAEVPPALWWTVLLLCVHAHWPHLRPLRVELPVTLGPGEAEVWLRLVDAVCVTLDLTRAARLGTLPGSVPARSVALVEDGPPVDAPVPCPDRGATATCFSGGKDSLLQLGLLHELGARPLAVATTSPLPDRHDQTSARRRQVLDAVGARVGVELVEVTSDLRALVDNDLPGRHGHHISVTELTDTFLYAAAALVVGWVRGAPRVLLASEAEVQENVELEGQVVQHPHHMYAAVSQRSVHALLQRWGVSHGSLTYALPSGAVQDLLWRRYPDLRDLQYSCWRVPADRPTCSECSQCLRIAVAALHAGGDPAEMGIDLSHLLVALADWSPSEPSGLGLPDDQVKASLHGQVVRNLAAVTPARVTARLTGGRPWRRLRPEVRAARRAYVALRDRVVGPGALPDPGLRLDHLELVDPWIRDDLAALLAEVGPAADPGTYRAALDRTHALVAWITAPLADASTDQDDPSGPAPTPIAPPQPEVTP